MKTVVTTREYDDQGRMVRETVTETTQADQGYYQPAYTGCTCPSSYCPMHYGMRPALWCGTGTAPLLAESIGITPGYEPPSTITSKTLPNGWTLHNNSSPDAPAEFI